MFVRACECVYVRIMRGDIFLRVRACVRFVFPSPVVACVCVFPVRNLRLARVPCGASVCCAELIDYKPLANPPIPAAAAQLHAP